MKLRHGMTVMTRRYPVVLQGRNQCFPDQWYGYPVIGGKINRKHFIVLKVEDVVALPVPEGYQGILPGLLKP